MSRAAAPALTQSDACLVAALTESWPKARWMRLDEFIGNHDWLVRGIPTFDEFSYGFPRLIGAGYGEVDGTGPAMRVRATPRAMATRRSTKGKTLGGVLWNIADAVGAPPYGEPQREDRSLGRLRGLEPTTWDEAVKAYHASWGRGCVAPAAGCLAALAAVGRVLLAVRAILRRRLR